MISASAAYLTENAKPNKVPIFLFEIEGYSKGFSNADLGAFIPSAFITGGSGAVVQSGTRLNASSFTTWPSWAQLNQPLTAGNLIIVMATYAATFNTLGPTAISDDQGNNSSGGGAHPYALAYSHIASAHGRNTKVWYGVAGSYPSLKVTETDDGYGINLNLYVLEVVMPTFDFAGASGNGGTAGVTLNGYVYNVAATNNPWDLVVFQTPHPVVPGSTNAIGLLAGSYASLGLNGSVFNNQPYSSILTLTPDSAVTATCYPWLIAPDDHMVTVNDLDGGADLADLVLHVQDRGNAILADFPTFVFEGKEMHLRQGFGHIDSDTGEPVSDMALADFVTLFTGKIDSVESENANNDYCFTCPDVRTELSRVIYRIADDGFSTDSKHVRTLNGHPLDILLAALQSEVGLDPSRIDIAGITTYRDTVYSGTQFEFTIDSPPVAKDFLEAEILKPMGAYMRTNNLGQVTVVFFYPLSTTPVLHFQHSEPADPGDNLLEIPEAGQADLINQVSTRFDSDGSNFLNESVEEDAASVAKYGLYGQQIIEAKGLRAGLNGFFFSSMTAFLIFLRYANKALCHGDNGKNSASSPINALWSAALVEPGDLVTITHPLIPNRTTGTMGITDKTYVVLDRTWQFFLGNVQFKLLEIDLSKFKQFLITEDGEASYTAASSGDKATLMFLCNDSDEYSNGDPANTLC
jgi:hypothetical protein